MPLTREEAVRELVEWHYEVDPNMTEVIRLFSENEDDPKEPIKFLEVSPDTVASGNVMTFTFRGTEDAPYNMRIATVTPDEMEQVRRGEMPLPKEWNLDNSVIYPPPPKRSWEGRRWHRSREIVRSPIVRSNASKPFRAYRMRSGVS